jgi:transcriptional regulator with XRE-family HTH domain
MQKDIGDRIRKMREAQELTREQVCRMTGLSLERLEAFEQGTEVPSIGVVIKLSRVLGSRVSGLIQGQGEITSALTIHRSGDRTEHEYGDTEQGYTFVTLTRPGTPWHNMEPFLLTFDPQILDARPISHQGQEFLYVLDGHIELEYEGAVHELRTGDSVYLDATRAHVFRGLGDRPSRVLAVVCSAE